MKKFVIIKLQAEGLHFWSECNIQEVQYLKYPHRHLFQITATKEVLHNDRDIEIIRLKHEIEKFLKDNWYSEDSKCLWFGGHSCEDIAERIIVNFDLHSCEVLEDGENGAYLINSAL